MRTAGGVILKEAPPCSHQMHHRLVRRLKNLSDGRTVTSAAEASREKPARFRKRVFGRRDGLERDRWFRAAPPSE